nr:MAG TPA: hypothetical protein [Bacteriophage sp.]
MVLHRCWRAVRLPPERPREQQFYVFINLHN